MCVLLGGALAQLFQILLFGPLFSKAGGKQIVFMGIAKLNQADLVFLKELLEAGKVKPMIDRRYPLAESAQAFEYLQAGHARGKIVITVEHSKT
jgi:NADPH:quinone reductase-like Zn-dependent oxidoreductase